MSDDEVDFDSIFEEPEDLKTAVGDGEAEMRRLMGNDRYEHMIGYQKAAGQAALDTDHAVAARLRGVAMMYFTGAWVLRTFGILAWCWSIFVWVIWALH